MRKFKILVLTDHAKHSPDNSLYPLIQKMMDHEQCGLIDLASRNNPLNKLFFEEYISCDLFVTRADESFSYTQDGRFFSNNLHRSSISLYDAIWLRLPPPLEVGFLKYLTNEFSSHLIFNSPDGILKTGSKEFMLNFPHLCPPMKICHTIKDITDFKSRFPIVLKPFRAYGGQGLIKIQGKWVWEGNRRIHFDKFIQKMDPEKVEFLGVKFLKNVVEGDKRIIVINGNIIGASLRIPPRNSWICNASLGGSSHHTEVDRDEKEMIESINPMLSQLGILIYGMDTLVDDSGKRVLSEINTTSIGGFHALSQLSGNDVLKESVNLIMDYVDEKTGGYVSGEI